MLHGASARAALCAQNRCAWGPKGRLVMDVPPLYLGACYGSEVAQQLLMRELAAIIAKAEWEELWVLLGQIAACIEQLGSSIIGRFRWHRV